jgi:hypothetical protein
VYACRQASHGMIANPMMTLHLRQARFCAGHACIIVQR